MIGIEMANDYGVSEVLLLFFSLYTYLSVIVVVYLSDGILFLCARARLLYELRWLCPMPGLFAFDPFIRSVSFFFNVISLSRWKIFMANGSEVYTQRVVMAKPCLNRYHIYTNSEIALCCLCIFFFLSFILYFFLIRPF